MSECPPPDPVPNNQDIPKDELDIFFRDIKQFLPPGKTFADLTPEELELVKNRYRFDYYRPGQYQGVTGLKGSI
jgi:hypothetical protein